MSNLAIITARGGSKRIPGKNIKDFLGKPIIAYSIEAALNSQLFSEVIVSTDDDAIAEISLRYGARVPFRRSAENSDDYATTVGVLTEVINQYESQGHHFENACCLYPTAPFVTEQILTEAFQKLQAGKFDVVIPMVAFSFPILRSFTKDADNRITYAFPENINKRSQDLPKYYHDAGQFYFFNIISFLEKKTFVGDNMYGLEVDELSVQDIDNETDWKLAEMKYQLYLSTT